MPINKKTAYTFILMLNIPLAYSNSNIDELIQYYNNIMLQTPTMIPKAPIQKDKPSIWQNVKQRIKQINTQQRGQFQTSAEFKTQQQQSRLALEKDLNAVVIQQGLIKRTLSQTKKWLGNWLHADPNQAIIEQAKLDFYQAGTASMINYDPDTSRLQLNLSWRIAIQALFPELSAQHQYINISPDAAKQAFAQQKTHPLFIQINLQSQSLQLEKIYLRAKNQLYPLKIEPMPASNSTTNSQKRYQIYAQGIIFDHQTQLYWQRCAVGQTWKNNTCLGEAKKINWQNAKSLRQRWHNKDWRLPSIKELRTLVHCSSGKPSFNYNGNKELEPCSDTAAYPTLAQDIFPNTPDGVFWSATPVKNSNKVWNILFKNGNDYRGNRTYQRYVRLVAPENP